jgi:ankyrin repeat protein
MFAAEGGHCEALRFLLDNGADPNQQNEVSG